MNFEYAALLVVILVSATLGSKLYPAAQQVQLRPALMAIALISLPFIVIDHLVTDWWWQFNPEYIWGWYVGRLPVEEIAFFWVVPWACLILWVNLQPLFHGSLSLVWLGRVLKFALGLMLLWSLWAGAWYTGVVCIIASWAIRRLNWQLLPVSVVVWLGLVLVLTLIFNGYLTARPIVVYNPYQITTIRVGTIPIEDFIYGLLLVTGVVHLYQRWRLS